VTDVAGRMVRDARRSLAWWAIGVAALVWVNVIFYPSVRDSPEIEGFVEDSPELMRALLGGRESLDILSPAGYLDGQVFALLVPLLLLIFAIGHGAGAIAGEEERGTLELLLANPVGRRRLVGEKLLGLVGLVAVFSAVTWLSSWTSGLAVDLGVSAARMLAATVAAGLLGLLFGALALAAGAATGRRGPAIGVPAALAVGAYLLMALAPLADWLEPWRVLSPFYYYASFDRLVQGMDWGASAILTLVTLVFAAAATVAFDRRDLKL
jgi:ABC-2 type transport system permease protein